MERYTIYCTKEQAKKAFDLGAPLDFYMDDNKPCCVMWNGFGYVIPTAEQMIGWLETKISEVFISTTFGSWEFVLYKSRTVEIVTNKGYSSRKEATLAAIDAALEYLNKKAKEE